MPNSEGWSPSATDVVSDHLSRSESTSVICFIVGLCWLVGIQARTCLTWTWRSSPFQGFHSWLYQIGYNLVTTGHREALCTLPDLPALVRTFFGAVCCVLVPSTRDQTFNAVICLKVTSMPKSLRCSKPATLNWEHLTQMTHLGPEGETFWQREPPLHVSIETGGVSFCSHPSLVTGPPKPRSHKGILDTSSVAKPVES